MRLFILLVLIVSTVCSAQPAEQSQHLLYVATPGIRNYLEYGGHGILVFDVDNNFKFIKRIETQGLKDDGTPSNVKGIAVSAFTNSIYVSTLEALQRIDLSTEKLVWEKKYDGGCDRMSISPDGKAIYLPSLEKEHWNVVDAVTGDVLKKIETNSGAHNTVVGKSGNVYVGGLRCSTLGVIDAKSNSVRQIGPFNSAIRPFTINASETRCFVNVNGLLGFEVGDIATGKKLYHVEVAGYKQGPVKRHGCPSHGIGLTPDESEIWLCDSFNQSIHIFDNMVSPPKQMQTLALRDQPGWITFTVDGKYAIPATGEIIDVKSKKIVASLQDENSVAVQSEKVVEIFLKHGKVTAKGDQFGIGRAAK